MLANTYMTASNGMSQKVNKYKHIYAYVYLYVYIWQKTIRN